MRRTLFRILLVVLIPVLLIQCSFPVSASENPSVSILSDKTEDNLIISIYFENVRSLTGAGFQLLYNEELLIPQSFKHKSGEWENLLVSEKYIEAVNLTGGGVIKYSGAFLNDISDLTDDAGRIHFADIIFDIKKGKEADVNGSKIEINAVFHFSGEKVPFDAEYIINPASDPGLPARRYIGDVDNDGKVTASDARQILRYSICLEDISEENLPYGNPDFNQSITAADARLALRASVNLESLQGHYYEKKDGVYLCLYCKQSFSVEKNHIHNFEYADCFSSGKCDCGADNKIVRGHIYSKTKPLCSICGINAGGFEKVYADISGITAKIHSFAANAENGIKNGDNYAVIEAALYTLVYYEDIIELTKDFSELKECSDELKKACDVLEKAVDNVTASSGDIYVNSANAVKLNKARLSAAESEKQAMAALDGFYEKNNLKTDK